MSVTTEVSPINTTDASMGNVISGQQVRSLPLEANNVVGLLSLQPGAVYIPNSALTDARTGAVLNIDPRSGAVSGSRADQSNVTLDGIDVNDPQFGTAYSSAVRVTLDSLQEFRVSTSNYGADSGRSSGAQVSLVTRSGTNDYHGAGNWVQRDTRFSSNDYFLKLSQLQAGEPSRPPKLDKRVYGGAFGGPIQKDRLFFFGNYERLTEDSETPVLRNVPSLSMRDGVLIYPCADPARCPGGTVQGFTDSHPVPAGHYGMGPSDLASVDPLGIGPSRLASDYFKQFPAPNDPGIDGLNLVGYRFAAPIQNEFNTYIGRGDYRAGGNHTFFGRLNVQDDAVVSAPQFPGAPANTTRQVKSRGAAVGWDAILSPTMVNTFRYGLTQIRENILGLQTEVQVDFRNIDPLQAVTATSGRDVPTHTIVDDMSWVKGRHTIKFGGNLRFTRVGSTNNSNSFHRPSANGSWVDNVGVTYMPGAPCPAPSTAACDALPAVDPGGTSTYGDTFIPLLGVISEVDAYYNYDRGGSVLPLGSAVTRRYATDEYEFFAQDSLKLGDSLTVTGGLRYSLFSPPWEVNGLQVSPTVNLGDWFEIRRQLMLAGRSTSEAPPVNFDLAGPSNGKPGYYDWDKNNVAPRVSAAWTPRKERGLLGALTGNGKMVVRGGYSLVYDRIGTAIATNFDREGAFGLSTLLSSPYGGHNEDDPAIRFAGLNVTPPTLPDAPPGGFPQTPPSFANFIGEALDGNIRTPYAHAFNVVLGRELGRGYSVEAAYVGRRGRNQLIRRDLAMPADLVDPTSGMDYFTAVGQLIAAAQGISRTADLDAYAGIGAIPYFEHLFPDAAQDGLSATQRMAAEFNGHTPDYITALYNADEYLLSGVQHARPVRLLLAAVRHARRREHDRALAVRRAAALRAEALQRGLPVRRELHVRAREGSRVARRGRQGLRRLHHGRLHRVPARLVESRQAVRQLRLRRPPPAERELDRGAAVRPRPPLRARHARRARRDRGRMGHGGGGPADQRVPVQRPQLPAVLDDELGLPEQRGTGDAGGAAGDRDDEGRHRRISEPLREPAGRARVLPPRVSGGGRAAERAARRRLLLDRLQPEQDVDDAVGGHAQAAVPVGHVQPDQHAELRRAVPGRLSRSRRHLRPLLQHAPDLRRRRRPVYAVCAEVRVLSPRLARNPRKWGQAPMPTEDGDRPRCPRASGPVPICADSVPGGQ